MTDKIDLTENRDFREPSNFAIERIIVDETAELANERLMSADEFEKIFAWEKIFGNEHHYSEIFDVFRDDSKWRNEIESHCQRCGKEFRLPWQRVRELCIDCDNILNTGVGGRYKKYPWDEPELNMDRNDDPMQIFNLR